MSKEKNYYKIKVKCENCDTINQLNIKKGIPVDKIGKGLFKDKVKGNLCENCGCETLILVEASYHRYY